MFNRIFGEKDFLCVSFLLVDHKTNQFLWLFCSLVLALLRVIMTRFRLELKKSLYLSFQQKNRKQWSQRQLWRREYWRIQSPWPFPERHVSRQKGFWGVNKINFQLVSIKPQKVLRNARRGKSSTNVRLNVPSRLKWAEANRSRRCSDKKKRVE